MPQFVPHRDPRGYYPFRQDVTLTIPSGQSISNDYADLEDCWTVVGLYMPLNWTAANVGFYTVYPLVTATDDPMVPVTGAVWQRINEPDAAGYLEIDVTAGEYTYLGPDKLAGCRYLKIWSVDSGEGVPQAEQPGPDVILVVRPV